jgi:hypothetical protein
LLKQGYQLVKVLSNLTPNPQKSSCHSLKSGNLASLSLPEYGQAGFGEGSKALNIEL